MHIDTFTSRFLKTNTYLASCDLTSKAVLIDPGRDLEPIRRAVAARKLEVIGIINTHAHADHVWGNFKAKQLFNAPIMIHEKDAPALNKVGPSAWINGHWKLSPPADRKLVDREIIECGMIKLEVIHTPGHTPGGICLRHKKTIFSGDTLFYQGIGRTDLKGGSYDQLIASIKDRLFILSDDIFVYPGHGKRTTIEDERKYNLFVRLRPEQIETLLFGPPRKKKPKLRT